MSIERSFPFTVVTPGDRLAHWSVRPHDGSREVTVAMRVTDVSGNDIPNTGCFLELSQGEADWLPEAIKTAQREGLTPDVDETDEFCGEPSGRYVLTAPDGAAIEVVTRREVFAYLDGQDEAARVSTMVEVGHRSEHGDYVHEVLRDSCGGGAR